MITLIAVLAIGIASAHGESTVYLPAPLKQMEGGTSGMDVICNSGLTLIAKISSDSSACVKPSTAMKLEEKGWGQIIKESSMMEQDREKMIEEIMMKNQPIDDPKMIAEIMVESIQANSSQNSIEETNVTKDSSSETTTTQSYTGKTTEITEDQAVEIAKSVLEGTVTDVGLEYKYAQFAFVVEILTPTGEKDVVISRTTGEVLGIE